MEDIKRKSGDLDNLKFLSRDLQSILNVSSENMIILIYHLQLNLTYGRLGIHFKYLIHLLYKYISFQEYEVKSNTYRGTLNDDGDDGDDDYDEPILKKRQISMAQSIQTKVIDNQLKTKIS